MRVEPSEYSDITRGNTNGGVLSGRSDRRECGRDRDQSVAAALPVHQAQLLTYMQLTGCPLGLLINFNVPRLMDGVKRLINPRASVKRRTDGTGFQGRNGLTD
jgi:hypothetical protein